MDTTKRSTCWSLTINNPTEDDEELISVARQKGWQVTGQKEMGAEGTLHYQLMLRTPTVRFSAVKKAFPRAHIEVARAPVALAKYVAKEETRVSALPEAQERYPSLSKFWGLVVKALDAINPYIVASWMGCADWDDVKGGGRRPTQEEGLNLAVKWLITYGYHVETLAVNPQVISAWKKFGLELMTRHCSEMAEREEQATSAVETEDSVSVPTTNGQEVSTPSPSRSSSPPSPDGTEGTEPA